MNVLDEIITVSELARKANLSVQRIRQLLVAGEIAGRKLDRDWILTKAEAKRFLASRKNQA